MCRMHRRPRASPIRARNCAGHTSTCRQSYLPHAALYGDAYCAGNYEMYRLLELKQDLRFSPSQLQLTGQDNAMRKLLGIPVMSASTAPTAFPLNVTFYSREGDPYFAQVQEPTKHFHLVPVFAAGHVCPGHILKASGTPVCTLWGRPYPTRINCCMATRSRS